MQVMDNVNKQFNVSDFAKMIKTLTLNLNSDSFLCNVLSCQSMEQKNVEISFRSPDEGYCMRYAKPLRFIPDSSVRCIEYTTERLFPKKMRFLVVRHDFLS